MTEAQKKANDKYNAKFVKLQIRLTPEQKKIIEDKATASGKSQTQYIIDKLINE